jgi:hypothetical protein
MNSSFIHQVIYILYFRLAIFQVPDTESPPATVASKKKIPEVHPMKTILATAMIVAFGITGISLWHAAHTRSTDFSSSQIYIHGTPVCVVRHDGEIVAAVGRCDAYGNQSWERGFGTGRGSLGESPYHREEPSVLPPGHPPVDSPPAWDQVRKIPI